MISLRVLRVLGIATLVSAYAACRPASAASGEPPLTPAGHAAYETLRMAPRFEWRQVGFGWEPSHYVEAWRTLFREEAADSAFKLLLVRGTPSGQLYGLAGLYFTDSERMSSEVQGMRFRDKYVEVQRYDIVRREGNETIASEIAQGCLPADLVKGLRLRPAT